MDRATRLKPAIHLLGVGACAGVLAFAAMGRDMPDRKDGAEIAMAVASGKALTLRTHAEPATDTAGQMQYVCTTVLRLAIADIGFKCLPTRTKTANAPVRR